MRKTFPLALLFCILFFALAPATPRIYTISGVVATVDGLGVEGVDVVGNNGAGAAVTAANGTYSITIENNWSGTITASKDGWLITPASKTYSKIRSDIANENYTAYQPTISGMITDRYGYGIEDANITAQDNSMTLTDANGRYVLTVPYQFSGAITPIQTGYICQPLKRYYNSVSTDVSDQNYIMWAPILSGQVKTDYNKVAAGVNVSIEGGYSVLTDTNGYFKFDIPYGWSGTITFKKDGYIEKSVSYSNLIDDNNEIYIISKIFTPCQPHWIKGDGISRINGHIHTYTVWDPDGDGPEKELLVIGGNFTIPEETPISNIAAWDGNKWSVIGTGMNNRVLALTVFSNELVAGGMFSAPGKYIAKWDGTNWQNIGSGMNNYVRELIVFDNRLIAGGDFVRAGVIDANRIAEWDGTDWKPFGSGFDSSVHEFGIYNGELIAGGTFISAGDKTVNRIAQWDGDEWNPLGSGLDYWVNALEVYNGELIVGGPFRTAGGVPAKCIARWNGTEWNNIGVFNEMNVYGLMRYQDKLLASTRIGTTDSCRIMCWDGVSWQQMGSSAQDPFVSLGVYQDDLYAMGGFWIPNTRARYIAQWDGNDWQVPSTGFNSNINDMIVYDDKLIAGGAFSRAGGICANGIASWEGSQWQAIGNLTSDYVFSLQIYNDQLIAGGYLRNANDEQIGPIACWDDNTWQKLDGAPDGEVYALAVYDGKLIAGGNGDYRKISTWDGTTWQILGNILDLRVLALAVYEGKLIVGGDFTTAGITVVNHIAEWDGTRWRSVGEGTNGTVNTLAVFDGKLVVGGWFTTAGSISANCIAQWDGTNWETLDDGMNFPVRVLKVVDDNLFAGGAFSSAGDKSVNGIARWDGATWRALGSGVADGAVSALASYGNQLIIGGGFTIVDGKPSAYWARWGTICGDLNCDDSIDLRDFDYFAWEWMRTDCEDRYDCYGADFDNSGVVDANDLAEFVRHWLKGI